MSRTMKRVPLDFSWPKDKVWKGYINPFAKLSKDCPKCYTGQYGPRGCSPAGLKYHQEWYGKTEYGVPEFDPVAYGSKPITIDNPRIREFATKQVNPSPEFYMTAEERRGERMHLQKAGIDLLELHRRPEDPPVEEEPIVPISTVFREAAIEREIQRLFEVCIKGHWCHHLSQADVDALVDGDRLWDFTRRPLNQEQADKLKAQEEAGGSPYWLSEPNGYRPTADEINDWALFGMGHDSINAWVVMKARAEREGTTLACDACEGTGTLWVSVSPDNLIKLTDGEIHPICINTRREAEYSYFISVPTSVTVRSRGFENPTEQDIPLGPDGRIPSKEVEKLCEERENYEPPEGPGYQLWEKVSEGSPVSPVFGTLDELCEWATTHSVAGTYHSKERWKKMLDENYVYTEHKMADGSTAIFV